MANAMEDASKKRIFHGQEERSWFLRRNVRSRKRRRRRRVTTFNYMYTQTYSLVLQLALFHSIL